MSIRQNILANYLGTAIVLGVPVLALPWYLSLLGPGLFGLISFVTMLQAVLGLIEAGVGQALLREFALCFDPNRNDGSRAASLLHGFERLYWIFALLSGAVLACLAPFIADHWLNLEPAMRDAGLHAVLGAAALFAVQFPGSVYRSLLVGSLAQVSLNWSSSGCMLLRHLEGLGLVMVWPSLVTYLCWQVLTGLCETLLRARYARGRVGGRLAMRGNRAELQAVFRTAAGLTGAILLGALTVQMDRIILSRMIGIESFGYYALAATVAISALQIIQPVVQAVLPKAVALHDNATALRQLSLRLAQTIGVITILAAAFFISAGEFVLRLWLQDEAAVRVVYPILAILLVGTAMNAFYNIGYINWLAGNKVKRIFQVNAASFLLALVCIPPMIASYGAKGAAFGWVAMNFLGLATSLKWLRQKHE